MNGLTLLGNLIIGPLKLLFETIYALANRTLSPGLSIVVLSLAMNLLVLPLYRRADAIQAEEMAAQKRMERWTKHIRKAFSGDERFMMQQTYYRQNHYSQLSILKGALPLLLEIPFFLAAYQFLSSLTVLQGAAFGPIESLGHPDALLTLGGLRINVLPLLMTGINLISSGIYTRGAPLKSKIQLYVMAMVFLIFLYPSPAGLTLYWTLNNLFSLVKNLLVRKKRPRAKERKVPAFLQGKPRPAQFFLAAATMALLTGLLIPSAVISASPSEFIEPANWMNPVWYAVNALALSCGTFLVWMGIFYLMAGRGMKKAAEWIAFLAAGMMLLNYMVFDVNGGNMSPMLQYDAIPQFTAGQKLINLAALAALGALMTLLFIRNENVARTLCLVAALTVGVMGGINLISSGPEIRATIRQREKNAENQAEIPLTTAGKNVIVLMLDRAISSHLPVILAEKPELAQSLDGFVYYPNTLSHGAYTIFGSPGLFGGYEYTPAEMNRRDTEPLREKHNEALRVMPVLFSREAGYTVTICDPPYADYKTTPDLTIFDDLPHVSAYITKGAFEEAEGAAVIHALRFRNFFCYSLSRTAPWAGFGLLYNLGNYNQVKDWTEETVVQVRYDTSFALGINEGFLWSYNALKALPSITRITDRPEGTFLMMANEATHEATLLTEPDYEPAARVSNRDYDQSHQDRFSAGEIPLKMENDTQMAHYHINMASFLQLGKWFDYMKQHHVYDNTRIILVSDHGRDLGQMDGKFLDGKEDLMFYNPLLMVKDFDSHGSVRTDHTFMTIADTPMLAMADIIEDPVNPFTGKNLPGPEAKEAPQQVLTSHAWTVDKNQGNTFRAGKWYTVQEDIFNMDNWQYDGER